MWRAAVYEMILGIGTDLIDARRIEAALARHGERFLARIFDPVEIAAAAARPALYVATLAKRFAAKEAGAKALGTGFRQGVGWRDLVVRTRPPGLPCLVLGGGAAARLARMLPPGHVPDIHLSMSDDAPYAVAFVVISARGPDSPLPEAACRA